MIEKHNMHFPQLNPFHYQRIGRWHFIISGYMASNNVHLIIVFAILHDRGLKKKVKRKGSTAV